MEILDIDTSPVLPKTKNHWTGKTSFILFIFYILILTPILAYYIYSKMLSNAVMNTEEEIAAQRADYKSASIVVGLLMMAGITINLIGFVLGIIGLTKKSYKKGFALAGTISHGLILFIILSLALIGILNR